MKKPVKWLLIFLALAMVVNIISKSNTPTTPEAIAAKELAVQNEKARKDYYAHPVIMAREVARKLEGINAKNSGGIQAAVQSVQQFAASKGKSPIDKMAVISASLNFDDMAQAYAAFTVPMNLPGNTSALLTGACADLKKSAQAGTETFLELQSILEGKPGSLAVVNKKMEAATRLRNEGMSSLNKAKAQLEAMSVPEYPQTKKQAEPTTAK